MVYAEKTTILGIKMSGYCRGGDRMGKNYLADPGIHL